MNNAFNIGIKSEWFNSWTHVDNWRNVKSLIHLNINVGLKKFTCVLLNNGKCKMQLLNNGFNMLKVDDSTHVPCDGWRNVKKIINPL